MQCFQPFGTPSLPSCHCKKYLNILANRVKKKQSWGEKDWGGRGRGLESFPGRGGAGGPRMVGSPSSHPWRGRLPLSPLTGGFLFFFFFFYFQTFVDFHVF